MAKGRRANGCGSIYANKNGGYTAQYRLGDGENSENSKTKFTRKSFKTKRECEEWLSEMKKKHNGLSQAEYAGLSITELAQFWFDYKKNILKAKTLDRIESTVNTHILPAIGNYRLCDITSELIQSKVFDKMVYGKNLSKSSVKKAYDDLNNFFNHCVDNDWLDKSPMKRVNLKKYEFKAEKKIRSFSSDEMEMIITSALEKYGNGKPFYECGYIFPVIYHTGMRIGEALGLKWKYVNLDEGYIDIEETIVSAKDRSTDSSSRTQIVQQGGKTDNSRRRIPLNAAALKYFSAQKERRYYGEEYYVFNIGRNDVRAMEAHNISRSFKNILEKNNIEHRGVHALRHTFATDLKENGVDELIISRLLGHSSSNVTRRYIDTRFNELQKAVETLNQ